ncbi:hypothetical protein CDD83_453 [Cordyceps sp. RAO-2017]|nr:hypothetical protein CDD83_453 [Cordyceps sp. RAO-2017]
MPLPIGLPSPNVPNGAGGAADGRAEMNGPHHRSLSTAVALLLRTGGCPSHTWPEAIARFGLRAPGTIRSIFFFSLVSACLSVCPFACTSPPVRPPTPTPPPKGAGSLRPRRRPSSNRVKPLPIRASALPAPSITSAEPLSDLGPPLSAILPTCMFASIASSSSSSAIIDSCSTTPVPCLAPSPLDLASACLVSFYLCLSALHSYSLLSLPSSSPRHRPALLSLALGSEPNSALSHRASTRNDRPASQPFRLFIPPPSAIEEKGKKRANAKIEAANIGHGARDRHLGGLLTAPFFFFS